MVDATGGKRQNRKGPFFFELSRLMVLAIKGSNGRLVSKAQTKPNGPWEADWMAVENNHSFDVMAAGLTRDGRVAVVAQPTSAPGVLYIDQNLARPNQEWNTPVNLGKPADSPPFTSLAMAVDLHGRVHVFGRDTNYIVWWKYQNPNRIVKKTVTITPPGTNTPVTVTVDEIEPPATPWSDWFQMRGVWLLVKALRNADGRIVLFGMTQNHLSRNEHRVSQALHPNDWSGVDGWARMDSPVSGNIKPHSVTAALDAAGAVNVFAIGERQQIIHARQVSPGSAKWTDWTTPGVINDGVQALAVGMDASDRLVVVATDNKNIHHMMRQVDVHKQQWSGWTAVLTGITPTRVALDYNADGRLTFFSQFLVGSANLGGLWCISQVTPGSTDWEPRETKLATDDIKDYAVVRDLTPPT